VEIFLAENVFAGSEMRCVLGLFEGGTGAADGHARMARDSVKRSDNVDSRSTRVGKTGADPSGTSVRTRLSAPFVAAFAIISVHLCDNLLGAKQDRGR
jgi:hypothetical protein